MQTYTNRPRVTVVKAPGYEDEWQATLLSYAWTTDARTVAVLEADDKSLHVIGQEYVREPRT